MGEGNTGCMHWGVSCQREGGRRNGETFAMARTEIVPSLLRMPSHLLPCEGGVRGRCEGQVTPLSCLKLIEYPSLCSQDYITSHLVSHGAFSFQQSNSVFQSGAFHSLNIY